MSKDITQIGGILGTSKNVRSLSGREDLSNFLYGKIPPQAIELEEAVLGALLLDKEALSSVVDILSPDSFYTEPHKHIYKAILDLFEDTEPIDMLSVAARLKANGTFEKAGAYTKLSELTSKLGSAANVEHHARIVMQKHLMRELISISNKVMTKAYDETTDVFDLLDFAEQGLYDVAQNNFSRDFSSFDALAAQVLKKTEELSEREDGLTGIPSGFKDLDKLTSGFQPTDLVILAARPGMGKTSLALAFARNAALQFGEPVAVFSLEMGAVQLAQRIISMEAEISISQLRSGKLEAYQWTQLNTTIQRMANAHIYIDDTPGISVYDLRAKARRLKSKHGVSMIIIDYLQLMTAGGNTKQGNREQEISAISRALKGLAKELEVPVIALSQLSRAVESRGGVKKPMLSDLRESGAIEQDADIVSFIYRPEYYDLDQDENGNPVKGIAEFIIAKHRNGATDTVRLKFTSEYTKFTDLESFDINDLPSDAVQIGNTITRPSSMNDSPDLDESPF